MPEDAAFEGCLLNEVCYNPSHDVMSLSIFLALLLLLADSHLLLCSLACTRNLTASATGSPRMAALMSRRLATSEYIRRVVSIG